MERTNDRDILEAIDAGKELIETGANYGDNR